MNTEKLELEARVRSALYEMVLEIVGEQAAEEGPELCDGALLAFDFGLESIEVVALLEALRARLGVDVRALVASSGSLAEVAERLSVRWVLDQALCTGVGVIQEG